MSTLLVDNGNGETSALQNEGTLTQPAIAVSIVKNLSAVDRMAYHPMLGSSTLKVAIPNGSEEFPVDLTQFSGESLYLVIATSGAVKLFTAVVNYSQDGGATDRHGQVTVIAGIADSPSAVLPKKGKFAHVTLSEDSAGETVWAYITGIRSL